MTRFSLARFLLPGQLIVIFIMFSFQLTIPLQPWYAWYDHAWGIMN
ncbi:MAG: hypothetical protein ACREIL_10365 [Nitrospiraceae bacterium]